MAYCPKCGNKIDEEAVYCNKCGIKLIKDLKEQKKEETIHQKQKPASKWTKALDITKKVGKFLGERAQIVAENLERDSKEGKGLFALPNWEPPNLDPLIMDIPKGITLNSYNDELIFGTKKQPKKRPYIPKALRVLIYKRDKGVCQICGEKVEWDKYDTGHDLAHSKGGLPTKENLFTCHPRCNSSMKTKSLKEMRKIMGFYK